MGLSSLVLLALGAGAQGFTKRRRRGQPEWLLWDSSVPKGCAVPRFCRLYNTFKVSLPPGVECLELKDGTAAWQPCLFFTLFVMAVEHVFREPGASPRLWEGPSSQSSIALASRAALNSDLVAGTALGTGTEGMSYPFLLPIFQ